MYQLLIKTGIFPIILLLLVSCRNEKPVTGSLDKTGKWKLVWHDEFNGRGLPDDTKWNFEEGFIRNRELQYYTKEREENVRVEKGCLVIEARKEKIKNPDYTPGSDLWKNNREFAEYSSGSINTHGKESFTYGRIEARIKLPHGGGVWPAFWTLGDDHPGLKWPDCGEIDILEYFGGEKPNQVESNMHFGNQGLHQHRQGIFPTQGPPEGFHIYAIEWFRDSVDFYFDDHKYWSFPVALADDGTVNAYRKPHYILMNFALGGSAAAGKVDESLLPQKYLIDYVRVYELK